MFRTFNPDGLLPQNPVVMIGNIHKDLDNQILKPLDAQVLRLYLSTTINGFFNHCNILANFAISADPINVKGYEENFTKAVNDTAEISSITLENSVRALISQIFPDNASQLFGLANHLLLKPTHKLLREGFGKDFVEYNFSEFGSERPNNTLFFNTLIAQLVHRLVYENGADLISGSIMAEVRKQTPQTSLRLYQLKNELYTSDRRNDSSDLYTLIAAFAYRRIADLDSFETSLKRYIHEVIQDTSSNLESYTG